MQLATFRTALLVLVALPIVAPVLYMRVNHPRVAAHPAETPQPTDLIKYFAAEGISLKTGGIYHCATGYGLYEYLPGDSRRVWIDNCGTPTGPGTTIPGSLIFQSKSLRLLLPDRSRSEPVTARMISAFQSFAAHPKPPDKGSSAAADTTLVQK